ncbi:MAG: hypothetical protein ACP5M0_13915 [Desulfomonilaceae bacterium]
MKCQSDFDDETEKTLRQADECVEPWWDGPDGSKPPEAKAKSADAVSPSESVEEEAVRRGLLRVDSEGETCLSCEEKPSK